MSQRVTRSTKAGQAYLDIQKLARRTGRNTDELLRAFVFERFLYRVSMSEHRHRFILKGGMLLAALRLRRPTVDIDMLARRMPNDIKEVESVVRAILAVPVEDDGVSFEPERMRSRAIREQDVYSGVRLEVPAGLASARIKLKIDINFGDPVVPGPTLRQFPRILEGTAGFEILCYALETVLAEKIETMIRRGEANTRWRDFADVLLLTRQHGTAASDLEAACRATFGHRGTPWTPVAEAVGSLATAGQRQWEVFCRQRGAAGLPHDFAAVLAEVQAFADPVITGAAAGKRWEPHVGWIGSAPQSVESG